NWTAEIRFATRATAPGRPVRYIHRFTQYNRLTRPRPWSVAAFITKPLSFPGVHLRCAADLPGRSARQSRGAVTFASTLAPTLNPVSRAQKRALVPSLTALRPSASHRRMSRAERIQRRGREASGQGVGHESRRRSPGDVPVGAGTRPADWTEGGERHQCQD